MFWEESCFHFSKAESQKTFVTFVTLVGNKSLVVDFVAQTLDKKPDTAISVDEGKNSTKWSF